VIYFVEIEEDENEFLDGSRSALSESNGAIGPMVRSESASENNQRQESSVVEFEDFSLINPGDIAFNDENMQQRYQTADDLLRSLPSQNVEFATRLPWERSNPIREIPPERFKMKRSVTVEDVIRDVSRFLGLWPPGYTDDPCPDIQKKLNSLSGDPSANPDMVRDLLMVRARYCD